MKVLEDVLVDMKCKGVNNKIMLDDVLDVAQVYVDALCGDASYREGTWKHTHENLNKLFDTGKTVVRTAYKDFPSNYYKDVKTGVKTEKLRAELKNITESVIKGGYPRDTLLFARHLAGKEKSVNWFLKSMKKRLKADPPETIVYVATGALEPALLISCALNVNDIVPIRFSTFRHTDTDVKVPYNMPEDYLKEKIEGKNVFVVEDVVMSGKSLLSVLSFVADRKPSQLRAGAVMSGRTPRDANWYPEYLSESGMKHGRLVPDYDILGKPDLFWTYKLKK